MINLLQYNRRVLLKSLYKRRLLVVALFCLGVALLPLVLVFGGLTYLTQMNVSVLEKQYMTLTTSSEETGTASLLSRIQTVNGGIDSFRKTARAVTVASPTIEAALKLRPNLISIMSFDASLVGNEQKLSIGGISGTRDAITAYAASLDVKNGGMCKTVSVPVETYTKRVDVPFTITCVLSNETK